MRHKPFPQDHELVFNEQCPLCNSDSIVDTGTPVEHETTPLNYSRCNSCNLIFMNPRPKQDWYNHLYKEEFWEVKNEKKKGQVDKQITKEAKWAEKFLILLKHIDFGSNRKIPQILEIGCAFGVIGKIISNYYSGQAYGVEPNDSARAIAEDASDVKIFAKNMDEVVESDKENLFDLIIFSHVLENITDPMESLKAAHRLLKTDGILLIDTPNNFIRQSWHIHHPYCYTKPSLENILNKTCFKIKMVKEWCRPRYIFGPIYLTVLAIKTNEPQPYMQIPIWKLMNKRIIGALYNNLFRARFFRKVNRMMAIKRWPISKENAKEVERIQYQAKQHQTTIKTNC